MTSSQPQRATASPLAVQGALVLVQLLFGANYVIAKVAFREVSPLGLVAMRAWGTAAIFALILALRPKPAVPQPKLTPREYGQLFVFSLLGISINQTAFLEGLARSTATNAAIILVMIPVVTLAFAVLLGREKPTVAGVTGIALGLAGALLIIVPRGGVDLGADAFAGNMLLLTCASSYALFLVLARDILARRDALTVVTVMFVMAALTLAPLGHKGVVEAIHHGISPAGWASIAFVTFGATAAPYLVNSWALGRAKSSVVAVYVLLQPIVAGVMGRLFLGERLGPTAALAAVLIVAGVGASVWSRSR
jgi:drug/metabolite transporter (DMT)-like permease